MYLYCFVFILFSHIIVVYVKMLSLKVRDMISNKFEAIHIVIEDGRRCVIVHS
jgi:hypothetical protein